MNGEVGFSMNVQKGEVIRFYLTNVANARTFNLSIPNAKIKRVGADLGKYEHETFVDSVLISPAERVVIEVYFPTEGNYTLMHTTPTEQIELSKFVAFGSALPSYQNDFQVLRDNTDVINQFALLKKYIYKAPDKKLALTVKLTGPKIDHSKHVHMAQGAITGTTTSGLPNILWDDVGQSDMTNTTQKITWELMDTQTRKINMDIDDWNFKKGDLVKVEITNDPNAEHIMQHPVHFHGQRFVVLGRNGVLNENMVWKDTTMVEPGETITILVEMSNPGMWMAHCHIAEHLSAGMMLNFTVADENGVIPNAEVQKNLEHSM